MTHVELTDTVQPGQGEMYGCVCLCMFACIKCLNSLPCLPLWFTKLGSEGLLAAWPEKRVLAINPLPKQKGKPSAFGPNITKNQRVLLILSNAYFCKTKSCPHQHSAHSLPSREDPAQGFKKLQYWSTRAKELAVINKRPAPLK